MEMYALTGDVLETSALVSERRVVPSGHHWDHDAAWLQTILICHGDEAPRNPQPWAALPLVVEQLVHDDAWPGL